MGSNISYAASLKDQQRFEEAKSLLRKKIRVTPRILGETHETTLRMRKIYAQALYQDPGATLDDLREAVTTLEDAGQNHARVFGGTHPLTIDVDVALRDAREVLAAREVDGLNIRDLPVRSVSKHSD